VREERACGDLHVHTRASDGSMTPSEVLAAARRAGLAAVAVTDHDTFEGAVAARRLAAGSEGRAPLVVVGCEARTSLGDVLVYCAEPLPSVPKGFWELADLAEAHNCVLVPAHPFDVLRLGVGKALWSVAGKVAAVECYNAMSPARSNEKARRAAELLKKPCTASSDAHIPEYVGVFKTALAEWPSSSEDVLELLRKGSVAPVVGRVGFKLLLKRLAWSLARRVA